jgi:hypothetical protein
MAFAQASVNIALIYRILLVTEMHDVGRPRFGTWDVVSNSCRTREDSKPEWSTNLAQDVHLHSNNSRLNLSRPNNSTNFVFLSSEQLFVHLREKACSIADDTERNNIFTRLDELQKTQGSPMLRVS